MPLRDDILNPIPGDNPSGENLRYAPVIDKIKEARRQEEDTGDQDIWKVELKTADYPLVIKLAGEVIATKSKDLQLAAWLTEALLAREGYGGLLEGLNLIKGLLDNFWDTLYPELEDGEAELRAAPVDWVGAYLAIPAKKVPINKAGHTFLKYVEAKAVGKEPAFEDSEAKREAYAAAIVEGKLSLDEFEKSVNNTSKDFYEKMVDNLDKCLQVMEDCQPLFEEKFGEFKPSYGRLRESLEEVRRIANQFLQKKIEAEGPAPEPEAPAEETPEAGEQEGEDSWGTPAPARKARGRKVTGIEPADKEEAAARLAAVAAYWRREDPYSPAPYLMLRGFRWGELRGSIPPDANLFEAPATDIRQNLKRMLNEGNFAEVIELGETSMAEPCGRAWLDLQRYVVTACENQGYAAVAEAIKSEIKTLVRDCPDLLASSLLDDTPAANNETVTWIKGFAEPEPAPAPEPVQQEWSAPPVMEEPEPSSGEAGAEAPPDSFQLAMEAVRSGRLEQGIEILADEIAHQSSGRGRFQRKLQLAQICMSSGQQVIAYSLLEELAEAIDRHQLESWEAPDVVAHALSLLYACMERTDLDPAQKAKLYGRICRLDPVQALKHSAQAFAHGR